GHQSHEGEHRKPKSAFRSEPIFWTISMAVVALALLVFPNLKDSARASDFTIVFLSIVLEAMPFVLVGVIVSGLIEVFVSQERLARLFPKSALGGVLVASGLAIVLPSCECAIVPVVRRLLTKGVPFGCAITYMLASPAVNPLVTLSTAVAFNGDPIYYVGRCAGGLVIAILAGLIIGTWLPGKSGLKVQDSSLNVPDGFGPSNSHVRTVRKKLVDAIGHASSDFFDVARYFILGAFIAASLKTFLPWEKLLTLHADPTVSSVALMFLAFVLNLCSEADAFVAASFTQFAVHAKLAFLWFGPMLDVKLMSMYSTAFSRRAIVAIAVVVPVLCLAAATAFYLLFGVMR
ncbi:MAG: permease, partial [Candidatus Brocadiia bacterium]